jgi:hypothetical protein
VGTSTGTATRINVTVSLLDQPQRTAQLATRNDTMNNSHIYGRKIDSPKIYVKDANERPKTSAQQTRKNLGPQKKGKKERQQESKKINPNFLLLGPNTQKEADARKFDFKFVQSTKADTLKREKKGKSVNKKKAGLNKSQVINFEKSGHHRTQTINGGLPSYEVVNLKLGSLPGASVLPSSLVSPSEPHS